MQLFYFYAVTVGLDEMQQMMEEKINNGNIEVASVTQMVRQKVEIMSSKLIPFCLCLHVIVYLLH